MAGASQKRTYHHGDLRRALLDAALRIIEKSGPQALTLREVARKVGVTQAAPYHHFADKEALLAAVAEEGFVEFGTALALACDAAGKKSAARLRAMGKAYFEFAANHPSHYKVMFGGRGDLSTYPEAHAAAQRAFGVLVETIAEAQSQHVIRRGDPSEIAVVTWSMVHGLAMLCVEGVLAKAPGEPVPRDQIERLAVETLIRGLAPGS